MTRTTELLKGCGKKRSGNFGSRINGDTCNEKKLCLSCKSELKGRLDALKEEIKYLREFQKILNNNCIYQIEDRLVSIQKEIKLIESAGVGK